jgi:hypothetical protein
MSASERPKMPGAQIVYGEVVYWITIVAAICCMVGPVIAVANIDNNVLNPHFLFQAIFDGKAPEVIWEEVGGGFPGGHFYKDSFLHGDGFSQFGLALGCSAAMWALICTAVAYLKDRKYLYVILALWVAGMVLLSAVGLIKGH